MIYHDMTSLIIITCTLSIGDQENAGSNILLSTITSFLSEFWNAGSRLSSTLESI